MNKPVIITIFFFLPLILSAQSVDRQLTVAAFNQSVPEIYFQTESVGKDTGKTTVVKKHSPKKAAICSAVIPGLGQAYNRKYWKIPIIYAGLIGSGAFILHNKKEMMGRQDALIAIKDGDPSTVPDPIYAGTSVEQLTADRNYYRANRDYGIIAFAVIYVLNIADATVDAHFYKFDIDKPLASQKTRHWYLASSKVRNTPTFGLAFRF